MADSRGGSEGALAPARGRRTIIGWARWSVLAISAAVAASVAFAAFVSHTATGRAAALRWTLDRLSPLVDGTLSIGSVGPGGIFAGVTLHDIEVVGAEGRPMLLIDSAAARYSLVSALGLGGTRQIGDLRLWSPVVDLSGIMGDTTPQSAGVAPAASASAPPDSGFAAGDATPGPSLRVGRLRVMGGTVHRDGEDVATAIAADLRHVEVLPDAEARLSARVRDLEVRLRARPDREISVSEVQADLEIAGGGARIELERLRALGSEVSGEVAVTLEDGLPSGRAELDISGLEIAELRWLDERMPPGTVSGGVALAVDGGTTEVELADLQVDADGARFVLDGGVAIGDRVSLRDLRIAELQVATSEARRWLPEVPAFGGFLEGELRIGGLPGNLSIKGDIAVVDGATGSVRGRARGGGKVLGVRSFERMEVHISSLDYTLLGHFAPDVRWGGQGELEIVVDGYLHDGLALRITGSQRLGEGPESVFEVAGTVFGDTAIASVDIHAELAPLSLEAIRQRWPSVAATGRVTGSVSLVGTVEDLRFDASLTTPGGDLTASGRLNGDDPAAGYELEVASERLDIAQVMADAWDTVVVSGRLALAGSGLDLGTLRGEATVAMGPSAIGDLEVDTVGASVRVGEDGVLRLEELIARAGGVTVTGEDGSLGVAPGAVGDGLRLRIASPSIRGLRPLFMEGNLVAWDELSPFQQESLRLAGADEDTFPRAREVRFDGKVDGAVTLSGSLHATSAEVSLALSDLVHREDSASSVQVAVSIDGIPIARADSAAAPNPKPHFNGEIRGDSVMVGGREFQTVTLEGHYRSRAGGSLHAVVARAEDESYEALAEVVFREEGGRLNLDRLTFAFPDRRWSLQGPASVEWTDEVARVNHFGLIRPGVPGLRLFAGGEIARGASSDARSGFEIDVSDLDLAVVGRLLQLERPPSGLLHASVAAAGRTAPQRWTGSLSIEYASHGGLPADSVVAFGSYRSGVLAGNLDLWTGGGRALGVEGTVPLNWGDDREAAEAEADSIRLLVAVDGFPAAPIVTALTRLDDVGGKISGRVAVSGRRGDAEALGTLRLKSATVFASTLGVRLAEVDIEARLGRGGTVGLSGRARSGEGEIRIAGNIDVSNAEEDVPIDLAFWPSNFQVANTPYMTIAATGDSITLTGSQRFPVLRGEVEARSGTVFLEEFERTTAMVDFYDPVIFQAATAGLGSEELGSEAKPTAGDQFRRNLVVQLAVDVGRGNWLRSRDLNVEPVGQLTVAFDRRRGQPVLEGEIEVARGTYSIGPRTFTMAGGSLLFVGTPGFNPGITLAAENRLRTRDGEPLVVTANISGTLLNPHLSLSSDSEYPISEADLYGYILFGRPTSALAGEVTTASVGVGRDLLVGRFVNQLGHLLTQELDVDHLSVSQSEESGGAFGASSVQVELGWYVLENVFLTGVYQRGFCADPTLPVASGGARVEVEMPAEVRLEGFLEGRCTRQRYRGFGDLSLELARIWGVEFFREWGY